MKLNRSAVMKDAWKRFRQGQRLQMGWTWSQCLSTAWAAARLRRDSVLAYHSTNRAGRPARPFKQAA